MKHTGILNRDLSRLVARLGHYDVLVVADAGLPIPAGVECVDLSLRMGVPTVLDIVAVVLAELSVESAVIAEEALAHAPTRAADVAAALGGLPVTLLPHVQFKLQAQGAIGVVRSGECVPYANVALVGGVTY